MNIILITGCGYGHRYVANTIVKHFGLAGIIVDHGKRISRMERFQQLRRRFTSSQLLSRLLLALYRQLIRNNREIEQSMISVFGSENCITFHRQDLIHKIHGINTEDGIKLVKNLQPDVILVFGTGIVGKRVLSQAKKMALNMHTGISPFYRGCDCAFWPIYNEEPDMVGATVHECTLDVDGGQIFATRRAQLQANDGMHTVFARAIATGADLYVETLARLFERGFVGSKQDLSIGKEYKAHMRGVSAECTVRKKIAKGLLRSAIEHAK